MRKNRIRRRNSKSIGHRLRVLAQAIGIIQKDWVHKKFEELIGSAKGGDLRGPKMKIAKRRTKCASTALSLGRNANKGATHPPARR